VASWWVVKVLIINDSLEREIMEQKVIKSQPKARLQGIVMVWKLVLYAWIFRKEEHVLP